MQNKQPWINEGWWTSEVNFRNEIRRNFNLPKNVTIHDATLRDGEQTPGVVLRKDDKLALAKALDEIGVDRIEAGMPAVSAEDYEAVKEIVKLKLKAKIMVFSRAMAADIDKAAECGVWGIVMEVPIGLPRLKYQFDWSIDKLIETSINLVNYARQKGLHVSYFPYDTTRAEMTTLRRLVKEVTANSKPDSLAVVDTTGCALPESIKFMVREVKKIADIPVEVHTHQDLGLAVANSLAAVEAGAEIVHVCINGLGERCGNAALDEIVVTLKSLLGYEMKNIRYDKLFELSRLGEKLSGIKLAANKSLAGRLTFTRESGLGVDVYQKEPRVAFSVHPAFVGRKFEMLLGKKSGRPSIRVKLDELGIEASEEQVATLLEKVKLQGIKNKGPVSDEEFKGMVREVVG